MLSTLRRCDVASFAQNASCGIDFRCVRLGGAASVCVCVARPHGSPSFARAVYVRNDAMRASRHREERRVRSMVVRAGAGPVRTIVPESERIRCSVCVCVPVCMCVCEQEITHLSVHVCVCVGIALAVRQRTIHSLTRLCTRLPCIVFIIYSGSP